NPFENGVNRYPDPQQITLKEALSASKGVDTEQLLLGNGSDEVLDLIVRTFCYPERDNIITLPPTYGMYKVLAGTNAIENREVLLLKNFQPDVVKIINTADQNTKLLFLCSPNNPTANSFKTEIIEELLEKFQGIVIIDEAYIDFSNRPSWISRLNEYPNLIITQTLSKAYGMAGIRLGTCYASKEIIALLNKIKPPYNVNELTQRKALDRVMDQAVLKKEVKRILAERERLFEKLSEIEFVKRVFPTDANFILAEVDNAEKRYNELLEHNIVVRNRSNQPLCKNTLRFTIGTPEENRNLITTLNNLST
nr:histidinol-phosphate transaminase [Flavobacteriaceae bacterium]